MPRLLARLALVSAVATLAVACGDDPSPALKTITLDAQRADLLAVREEGGDWRAVVPAADGTATIEVGGPYVVATACDTEIDFGYRALHAAPDDADRLDVSCDDNSIPPVIAAIADDQIGEVHVGLGSYSASEAAWLRPGRHDLVAIDGSTTPPRVAIQRDVEITGDTTLFVDLDAGGVAMNPVTVATDVEDPYGSMALTTDDGTIARRGVIDGVTFLVPPSLVVDSDVQVVSASIIEDSSSRRASVAVDGGEPTVSITFPEGISAATYTPGASPGVTWTASRAFDVRAFRIEDDERSMSWDAVMLAGYAEALGVEDTLTIPDPGKIPGWDPAWYLRDLEAQDWSVELSTTAADGSELVVAWDPFLF